MGRYGQPADAHPPNGWTVKSLGDFATVRSGIGFPPRLQGKTTGEYPFFKVSDMNLPGNAYLMTHANNWVGPADFAELRARLFEPRTIIFPKVGGAINTNKKRLLSSQALVDNNVMGVLVEDEGTCESEFLFWWFNELELASLSNPGPLPSIKATTVRAIHVPLPPLPEQRAIAHILRTVQQAKEATENIIAAARQLKQSLMHHLFTYGTVPFGETDRVRLTRTTVGTIPADWSIKDLYSVTRSEIKNGAFIKRNRFGTGVPFLNVADIYKDLVAQLSLTERVAASEAELQLYGLAPGDIIFVRSSLKREGIGQCCIIDSVPESAIYDCHLMRVRVNDSLCDPKFVVYYFSSPGGRKSVISMSKTTTMTTINQKSLGSAAMPVPPIAEQCAIRKILERIDEKIHKEEARKTNIDSVFRCLLQTLMSGTIRAHSRNTPQKVGAI